MLKSRVGRSATLFVTGMLAVIPALGCSSDTERSPTLESASSPAPSAVVTDSAIRKPDTSSTVAHAESTTAPKAVAEKPGVAQPAGTTARPKPVQRLVTDSAASSTPAAPAAEGSPDKWLSYDAATNTVTFELIAGPFTFNGYRNGEATLALPPKANVVINFVNKDGTPHSAIVISGDGPVPNSATDPAIPRAYTNKVLEGLPQEASDVMRFQVPETGTYRIFCGVPGHGLSGMWIWMKVDPAAKAPSFGPSKA
jgi:sulfocyanin SoxE-like protein